MFFAERSHALGAPVQGFKFKVQRSETAKPAHSRGEGQDERDEQDARSENYQTKPTRPALRFKVRSSRFEVMRELPNEPSARRASSRFRVQRFKVVENYETKPTTRGGKGERVPGRKGEGNSPNAPGGFYQTKPSLKARFKVRSPRFKVRQITKRTHSLRSPGVSVDFYTVSRGDGGLVEGVHSIFTKRTHAFDAPVSSFWVMFEVFENYETKPTLDAPNNLSAKSVKENYETNPFMRRLKGPEKEPPRAQMTQMQKITKRTQLETSKPKLETALPVSSVAKNHGHLAEINSCSPRFLCYLAAPFGSRWAMACAGFRGETVLKIRRPCGRGGHNNIKLNPDFPPDGPLKYQPVPGTREMEQRVLGRLGTFSGFCPRIFVPQTS